MISLDYIEAGEPQHRIADEIRAVSESIGPKKDYMVTDNRIELIKTMVLNHFNQTWEDIAVSSRKTELVRSRQLIMYFCQLETNMSLVSIADLFGRHHSTVLHAIDTICDLQESDKKFKAQVDLISNLINKELI